jgi:Tfp pilus assembly protein FimT
MDHGRTASVEANVLHQFRSCGCGLGQTTPLALRRRTLSRPAFTLVEILLVLVLLVIVGSLSIPYLFGSFARSQLRNGGDLVQSALAEARLTAMETGQVQVLRCELKGRRFQLGSMLDLAANGDKSGPTATTAPTVAAPTDDGDKYSTHFDSHQLPSGVVFASGDVAPSAQLLAMLGTADQPGWTSPIVFSPDGTATDATLLLVNEGDHTVRITLRGLTGVVRVGEIDAEEATK